MVENLAWRVLLEEESAEVFLSTSFYNRERFALWVNRISEADFRQKIH
jgi:hypothetical protein